MKIKELRTGFKLETSNYPGHAEHIALFEKFVGGKHSFLIKQNLDAHIEYKKNYFTDSNWNKDKILNNLPSS